jgi:hypothetical protein
MPSVDRAKTDETPLWRLAFFMLGCYAFGFNLHSIMHELGHAVAIWLQGGAMTGFFFHPFDACYNYSTSVPNHTLLYAGGALFGGTATLLFPILAARWRTAFMAPLVAACMAGLVTTSRWMILVSRSTADTDYSRLVELGVPAGLIIGVGIVFLLLGVSVFVVFLPLFGISPQAAFGRRLLVLELGIVPYFVATKLYFMIAKGASPVILASLITPAVFFALVAVLSWWFSGSFGNPLGVDAVTIERKHVIAVWIATAALLTAMAAVSVTPPP